MTWYFSMLRDLVPLVEHLMRRTKCNQAQYVIAMSYTQLCLLTCHATLCLDVYATSFNSKNLFLVSIPPWAPCYSTDDDNISLRTNKMSFLSQTNGHSLILRWPNTSTTWRGLKLMEIKRVGPGIGCSARWVDFQDVVVWYYGTIREFNHEFCFLNPEVLEVHQFIHSYAYVCYSNTCS